MEGDLHSSNASRLLDTFNHLAHARDEAGMLTALAIGVAHLGPAALVLAYVHADADGSLLETEIAHISETGQLVAEHHYYGVRMPAGSLRRPGMTRAEPLVVVDIMDDLDVAAHTVALGLPTRSFVGLPLYSERHGAYQGVIGPRRPDRVRDASGRSRPRHARALSPSFNTER